MLLVLVLGCLMPLLDAVHADAMPLIYTKGSHFQVGDEIGRTYQSQIKQYFQNHHMLHRRLLPYAQSPEGGKVVSEFIGAAFKAYPELMEEMYGVYIGSGVPFLEIFLMNIEMELTALILNDMSSKKSSEESSEESIEEILEGDGVDVPEEEVEKPPAEDIEMEIEAEEEAIASMEDAEEEEEKEEEEEDSNSVEPCTDLLVNRPTANQMYIAHNEDTSPLVKLLAYIVHAEIVIDGKKTQEFVAFTYPGLLSGNGFSFNNHGLVFTVNALYPKMPSYGKIGRYFITRALMAAKSVEDARRIMEEARGVGAAYGFSVNIATMTGERTMWNFENAPIYDKQKTATDGFQVQPDTSYFHVNQYQRLNIDEIGDRVKSSVHRAARINELPAPIVPDDALKILADEEDNQFPIYRTSSPKDHSSTIATALFDLNMCTMSVYRDRPDRCEPTMVLEMPCCGNKPVCEP